MSMNLEIFSKHHISFIWTGTHPDRIISGSLSKKLIHTFKTLSKLLRTLLLKSKFNHGFLISFIFFMEIIKNLQEKYGWLSSVVAKKSLNLYKKLTKDSNSKICTKIIMIMMKMQLLLMEKWVVVAVWRRMFTKLWRLFKEKLNSNPEEQISMLISTIYYTDNGVQLVCVKFSITLQITLTIMFPFQQLRQSSSFIHI